MNAHAQAKREVPAATKSPVANGLLQRKCACGGSGNLAAKCERCKQETPGLKRKAVNNKVSGFSVPLFVNEVLRSPGQRLDAGTRALFEPRFGHDFSQVRTHTDAKAAESARAVNELAYTAGSDVVFASDQYQPLTQAGRHLIAHEPAHTIQQGGKSLAAQTWLQVGESERELEKEADGMADRVMKGGLSGSAPPLQPPPLRPESSSLLLQRSPTEPAASSSSESSAEATPAEAAPSTTTLIVEDEARVVAPGQMRKSEFLAALRAAVCTAADAELSRVGRNTESCPYIARAFDRYRTQNSRRLERSLRRYAPEAAGASTAGDYISAVSARVSRAVGVWATSGEITGIPEELVGELGGFGMLAGFGGLLSGIGSAMSGLIGGVSRAFSGLGRIFFKAGEGGVREEGIDPEQIKSQLGEGQTLDGRVKSQMEQAFGHDFSRVRVHTDSHAAGLSTRLNARAFTIGSDIAFGEAEYQPGTLVGDALLAHELAHVVQQRGAIADKPLQKEGSDYDQLEDDADASAVGVMASLLGLRDMGTGYFADNAMPRLRSGLRLNRCGSTGPSIRRQPTSGVAPRLRKETTVGPMDTIDCGGYLWSIRWVLDRPSPQGGWVVQRIDNPVSVSDCNNREIDVRTRVRRYDPGWYPFWEAWRIESNRRFTPGVLGGDRDDDSYTWLQGVGEGTKGNIVVRGTAEFYEGLSLPSTFRVNRRSPAGELHMTQTAPNLPGGTGPIPHNLTASWNCCPDGPDHRTRLTPE